MNMLDEFFKFMVEYEIPSLYLLIEVIFMALGWYYFLWCIATLKNVKQLTGNYSQTAFQIADVSPLSIIGRFFASVFLMSYGQGQALIANSIFVSQDFAPYSIEMFRSISCANGSMEGCLHYDLGLYQNQSWESQVINANFFNLTTALMQIFGAIAYGRGWHNVGRLGDNAVSGKAPPTFGGALTQLILGVAFMHPLELWEMFT
ncbi:hypothetical protein PVK62_08055 [Aliivibrio sp. S3MY1]|uniref:Uncharacterized protein n=1 Tax=Aliivibrio wodanis TaxID=80852 RepID=A0A5Q4ZYS4_9GAMM|nr:MULTISPECIES: hypothetical protein [Aliivibrio]MDD9175997.1 hypothetical protein [Aliivibrio sp. S3TY1]MDD9193088.1 hypothetical protein [Aliivibrio sp. S2TY2]MDD9195792.1 hypothetical protein [Aliivibrio sp. S3MY1]VVV07021.1 hypothetical protein AW0309160_04515 [Aliivibrio wodanis]